MKTIKYILATGVLFTSSFGLAKSIAMPGTSLSCEVSFKVEDLSRLLRMMRTRANKNSIIRDMGDLLAHEDIRDSGPLFLRGKEMYDSIKFNTECIHGNGLNLAKAPNNLWALILKYLLIDLNLINAFL